MNKIGKTLCAIVLAAGMTISCAKNNNSNNSYSKPIEQEQPKIQTSNVTQTIEVVMKPDTEPRVHQAQAANAVNTTIYQFMIENTYGKPDCAVRLVQNPYDLVDDQSRIDKVMYNIETLRIKSSVLADAHKKPVLSDKGCYQMISGATIVELETGKTKAKSGGHQ
jgi:hypothetical protein